MISATIFVRLGWRVLTLLLATTSLAVAANDPVSVVPAHAPRTTVLAGREEAFRAYCTTGPGSKDFSRIKKDLDERYLALPFPTEPVTYGDPTPSKRTSDMADRWRDVQDTCGVVTGVAEAGTLCWIVTGEEKYLAKAKAFLLAACLWHFDPNWRSGPVVGATDIAYNDEAHFRLWRKLPLVYDQIRGQLSESERAQVLAHFRERGDRNARWLAEEGAIATVRRNSPEGDSSSHPIRFMPMTGLAGLALWDDLPAARAWWELAYTFYRDQFAPWGGDDGGWAEGSAYWRGTFEHAVFQDALLAIGDPSAYASTFWKNSPYFGLYNVQPYRHTTFGDAANAGHFNLEPVIADAMEHFARVEQNGFFLTYGQLGSDSRTRPSQKGLAGLDRAYPTAAEFLVRNFTASQLPLPAPQALDELPSYRFFSDVGWVSLHSALGHPNDDIQVTFKSSRFGSFSHSHADQNAFILNAYGESLAINSAYREYHNSPHHQGWTRQTKSKNALLIDGIGQKAQSKEATGKITRFETTKRTAWTTGDATAAYQAAQTDKARVQRVTRDVVFIDQRYIVLRDRVTLTTPGKLAWLLHAERKINWQPEDQRVVIEGQAATLTTQLVAPGVTWTGRVTDEFPIPVDPKYAKGKAGGEYVTGNWSDQAHFTAESTESAREFSIFAVMWPERGVKAVDLGAQLSTDGILHVRRPDGKRDSIRLTDTSLDLLP
ncbi:MAG: heparinase II/III family protein [Opitutus sp.]